MVQCLQNHVPDGIGVRRIVRNGVERHDEQRCVASVLKGMHDTRRKCEPPRFARGNGQVGRPIVLPIANVRRTDDGADLGTDPVKMIAANVIGPGPHDMHIALWSQTCRIERFEYISARIGRAMQLLDPHR